MRIVTWNCNRTLGRKLERLLDLTPDVAVIQECERDLDLPAGFTYSWMGAIPSMGLGVLARDPAMKAHAARDERWTFFLPVELPNLRLRLLATWAFNHRSSKLGPERIGGCLPVLEFLGSWLSGGRGVMAGDFNHNPRWDTPRGKNNFVDVCARLGDLGLKSAYHAITGEDHGAELQDTHFLQRNAAKGYHIDYCFLHSSLQLRSIHLPRFEQWRGVSDHLPLIVDVVDT